MVVGHLNTSAVYYSAASPHVPVIIADHRRIDLNGPISGMEIYGPQAAGCWRDGRYTAFQSGPVYLDSQYL